MSAIFYIVTTFLSRHTESWNRACARPTAARVLEIFAPLGRTVVKHSGDILTVAPPQLNFLQEQLLGLLEMPLSVY